MIDVNWKRIALRAWSMWSLYLIAALQIAPEVMTAFSDGAVDPLYFDVATALAALAGAIGRVVRQAELDA